MEELLMRAIDELLGGTTTTLLTATLELLRIDEGGREETVTAELGRMDEAGALLLLLELLPLPAMQPAKPNASDAISVRLNIRTPIG